MTRAFGGAGRSGAMISGLRAELRTRLETGLRAWLQVGLVRSGSGSVPRAVVLVRAVGSLGWVGGIMAGGLVKHGHGAGWTGTAIALFAAFCLCYVFLVGSRDVFGAGAKAAANWRRLAFIPLFVLAAVVCVVYGGARWNVLWVYVSLACGLVITDRRMAARGVAVTALCFAVFSWIGHDGVSDFLIKLLITVLVGLAVIGGRMRVALVRELTRARETVLRVTAASEERLRLARDLHDLTGQSLSMITLKSELAARLLRDLPDGPGRDRARDEIEQVAAVSRQTLHDIREAISGYRRPTLAVEIITARAALESAGIALRDDADLTLLSGTFDPDAEAALAWCLREAVTNVVRHSGANNCYISLTCRDGALSLEVADDGRGHVPPDERDLQQYPAGTGLRGMSERLAGAGGALEIKPGGGTGRGFALTARTDLPGGRPRYPPGLIA